MTTSSAVTTSSVVSTGGLDEARRRYPADVTALVLLGRVDPPGFVGCVVPSGIGGERFGRLRNGESPTGAEHDAAATCLLELDVVLDLAERPVAGGSGGDRPESGDSQQEEADRVDLEQADIEEAATRFPPKVTAAVLRGRISAPAGFDECVVPRIGGNRLGEIRDGAEATGSEHDAAAVCLVTVGAVLDPAALDSAGPEGPGPGSGGGGDGAGEEFTVSYPGDPYRIASGATSGPFRRGQSFDLTLSAIGFNQTGGALLFNRPSGLSSDGTRLVMADTFNNRVLVWNELPTGNVEPDLVLGQGHFGSNEPGTGLDRMNWPVTTATAGGKLLVADTQNDRILVWTTFPTASGQPADLVLSTPGEANKHSSSTGIDWPWGVWTDGTKVVVSSTMGGRVLVWTSFPTRTNQLADLTLTGGGAIGTPRQITSDGTFLIVGDHNATASGRDEPGTFVWSKVFVFIKT